MLQPHDTIYSESVTTPGRLMACRRDLNEIMVTSDASLPPSLNPYSSPSLRHFPPPLHSALFTAPLPPASALWLSLLPQLLPHSYFYNSTCRLYSLFCHSCLGYSTPTAVPRSTTSPCLLTQLPQLSPHSIPSTATVTPSSHSTAPVTPSSHSTATVTPSSHSIAPVSSSLPLLQQSSNLALKTKLPSFVVVIVLITFCYVMI